MSLCVYAIYVNSLVNIHLVMLYYIFDTVKETQIVSTVSSVENHSCSPTSLVYAMDIQFQQSLRI